MPQPVAQSSARIGHVWTPNRAAATPDARATAARRTARTLAAIAIAAVAIAPTPAAAQKNSAAYRAAIPASAVSDDGLFTVHRVGDRLKFEIPDSILGRDMAVMSRYAKAQTGLADGGDRMAPNMVVRWLRRGDRIDLRA